MGKNNRNHCNKKYTVLITGAGSGIGKSLAIELANKGYKVIATCRYEDQVVFFNNLIKNNSDLDIQSFKLDILDLNDRKKINSIYFNRFISNAGIGDSGAITEVSTKVINKVFQTNVIASIDLIQLVISKWVKENMQDAKIIIASSLVGKIALPFLGPYCISKFAIEAYAECLKYELKLISNSNIKVCLVEPGSYNTGFNRNNTIKMYNFMKNKSYYSNISDKILYYQTKFWNLSEKQNLNSIVNKYIQAIESKSNKFRYSAPFIQSFFVQLGRIFGM